MAYMLGILVFLGMLAVCWFGFMAAERRAGSTQLGMAPRRTTEPHHTSSTPSPAPGPAASPAPNADEAAARPKPAVARSGDKPTEAV
ncbi:hypothetical protein [Cereibacter sediminicola]|uniref:hypothetical protein n=1 Tax=Cereibacter sediminicola TaxID=2584941 RepID=UPI0011A50B16|nr:hypothetical protein [Cereibacter sediminicola]